ncbi:hypothetical protein [Tenacibaculum finnmarkense]|uniref:hypothetical protein n=1 Tax=Tenacibaculum finnmarkense TaxID=2781243 RepID=UPI00187B7447|nr:hypothetical protein [Tenacibaculum finnmarkense]MBE7646235.1 hypothetical protein [Tenacibaculum finnmarkense genomovar ulcerans]MCD8403623.1 hypothetical protein [Tenacibaculum finnmarkense genomovar finnmarkense]MCG8239602.1 hypothetical protein [Tenacibaculum finnmarkense genomovar ulcerans]MCG8813709.1 hypothetical protein [Tenacibaculum finnmarkense]
MKKTTTKKISKNLKSTSDFVSENKKQLLYVGGSIILLYAGYKAYKGIKNVGSFLEEKKTEKIKITINTKNAKISSNQATNLAKALFDAMNHETTLRNITDWNKIDKVFDAMKNGDDFKLIYKAFGEKLYFDGGTPTNYFSKKLANSYDLIHWLRDEVDSYWNSDLYKKIDARVKSAGLIF